MLNQTSILSYLPTLLAGSGALLVLYYLIEPLLRPLRDIPGPFLARYTRLWELYQNWRGQFEHVTVALHKQYGDFKWPKIAVLILTLRNRSHRTIGAESIQHQRSSSDSHDLRHRLEIQQI